MCVLKSYGMGLPGLDFNLALPFLVLKINR